MGKINDPWGNLAGLHGLEERKIQIQEIQETITLKAAANLNLTNEDRAERAACALLCYLGGDPDDLTATIVDLVTDLMHLARLNDIEPDYVARCSQDHYITEVEEEAGL